MDVPCSSVFVVFVGGKKFWWRKGRDMVEGTQPARYSRIFRSAERAIGGEDMVEWR